MEREVQPLPDDIRVYILKEIIKDANAEIDKQMTKAREAKAEVDKLVK